MKDIKKITEEKIKEGKILPFEISSMVGSQNIFSGPPVRPQRPEPKSSK